jgi:O-antigen ligase
LVGLAISGSRTALILGGVSFILSIALISGKTMARLFSIRHGRAAAAIAMLFLLPILFGVGFVQIFLRLQTQDTLADLRYQIFDTLWRVMTIYMPFGSGFGTFDTVYQMHESLGTLSAFYVNHAHNDVLELLIEGGARSAIALIGFGVGLVGFTISAFAQTNLIEERIEKACVISLWMLTIHSFWDYPLRTIAVSSLFGIAFGSLVKPRVINIETLSDVFHRMKARRFYEWIETTIGKQSQRRRRQRLSRPH